MAFPKVNLPLIELIGNFKAKLKKRNKGREKFEILYLARVAGDLLPLNWPPEVHNSTFTQLPEKGLKYTS